MSRVSARVLLIAAVAIWGWTFVATKICLRHMSPLELMALRFGIAVPVLGGMLAVGGVGFRPRGNMSRLAAGSLVFALHFFIQISGLVFTSATNTGWLIAVTPLVLMVLAYLFLGERLGRRGIAGAAIATAGILLLVLRSASGAPGWSGALGDWLVLASAHTWAIYTIVTRDVSRQNNPLLVTFLVLLPAAALSLGVVLVGGGWRRFVDLPSDVIVSLLYLGIAGTAMAQWFWQIALARIGAAESGLYLFLEPVATMILAVPLLGEPFGLATVAGGMLVVGGVYIARRRAPDVLGRTWVE